MSVSLFHLHGDLKDIRFAKILTTLREDHFTGVFQVTTRNEAFGAEDESPAETTREVQFADGHVAWAISTDKQESLRCFLQRGHNISDQQWALAEERAHEGTLRQALSDLGLVEAASLEKIERQRAEEIVLELFSAAEGEYRIRERQLSPGTPDLEVDVRSMILKGIVERADRNQILGETGSLATIYEACPRTPEGDELKLPGEFRSVLEHIDGKSSIGEICSATSLPDHYACSLFAALSMIGAVRKAENQIPADREVRSETVPIIESSPLIEEEPVTTLESETVEAEEEKVEPPLEPVVLADEILAEQDIEEPDDRVPSDPSPALDDPREAWQPSLTSMVKPERESSPLEVALDETPPSAYGDYGGAGGSRPWILLGGAAAVGILALSIILMAQDRGDASERVQALPVLEDPLADEPGYADSTEEPDRQESTPPPPPRELPPPKPKAAVAPPSKSNILDTGAGDGLLQRGRRSLDLGNLRSAASYFDRALSSRAGRYTIQLLTACQEETISRAVSQVGTRDDLFILSTTFEGRSCYRMFWGTYVSRETANAALGRDVPAFFRRDRNPPRVVAFDKL